MYNRYIPQPDGSYRRSSTPDRVPQKQTPPPPRPKPKPQPPAEAPCPAREPEPSPPPKEPPQQEHLRPEPARPPCRESRQGIGQFFRQLLPKDFDTADLLILLLLLLMAGDDQEDQNCTLLTLALYLFL